MTRDVPEIFQARLDQFNDSQGGPSYIALAWNPRTDNWCAYAIPRYDSQHPLARHKLTKMLMRPLVDGSSREGVFLFNWPHAELDERLFKTLVWADSFRDKQHFEKTVDEPEAKREAARDNRVREAFSAAREYWRAIDRTTVPVNPLVPSTGDWRASRIR